MYSVKHIDLRRCLHLAALGCGMALAMPALATDAPDVWDLPMTALVAVPAPSEARVHAQQEPAPSAAHAYADEISAYLDQVEARTHGGRFRGLEPQDRSWVLERVASLRLVLAGFANGQVSPLALQRLTAEFAVRIAELEQGGIVCRHERRTGSALMNRRCFTRKRLEQQTIAEQERWRRMTRPGTGTSKSMALTVLR